MTVVVSDAHGLPPPTKKLGRKAFVDFSQNLPSPFDWLLISKTLCYSACSWSDYLLEWTLFGFFWGVDVIKALLAVTDGFSLLRRPR